MTDSFARLLDASQGKGQSILPHNQLSKTNYGEVEHSTVKATNERLDDGIADSKESLRRQLDLITFMARKRGTQEKQLLNIVESGVKLNRWRKESAKNWASFKTHNDADVEKELKSPITGKVIDYKPSKIDYSPKGEEDALKSYNYEGEGPGIAPEYTQLEKDAFNVSNQRHQYANDESIPSEHRWLFSTQSPYEVELDNDKSADAEILTSFKTALPSLGNIKFYDAELDRYISYYEAMDSDDLATRTAGNRLLQKMYAEFATANQFSALGDKYVYRNLWKTMKTDLDSFHEKNLNVSIRSALERSQKKRYLALGDKLLTANKPEDVNQILFGELGYASRFNTATTNGLLETQEALVWLIDNDPRVADIILSSIDLQFTQKGTDGQTTTLEKLSPTMYGVLLSKASNQKASSKRIQESTDRSIIDEKVQTAIEDSKGDDGKLWDLVQPLLKEYNQYPWATDPIWNTLKNSLNYNEQLGVQNLGKLIQAYAVPGRRLNEEWLEGLSGDLLTLWKGRVKERGGQGLSQEQNDSALRYLWKQTPLYTGSGDVNLDTLRKDAGTSLQLSRLNNAFQEEFNKAINTLGTRKEYQDINVLLPAAQQLAMTEVTRRLKLNPGEDGYIPITDPVARFTESEIKDQELFLKEELNRIKEDPNKWISNPKYNNKTEEVAIQDYIKYKKGEIPNIPSYFTIVSKPYKNLNAQMVADQRVLATQKLRTDDGSELIDPNEDKVEGMDESDNNQLNTNKSSLPRYIVQPKHAAQILEKFNIHGDVDYVGSERNPQKRSQKPSNALGDQKLSELTLRDLLAYNYNNEHLRLGKYGLTWDAIIDQQQAQNLDIDLPFDDNLQNQIMLGRILQKRNEASSGATLDNTYRRVTTNWTQADKDLFNSVLGGYLGPGPILTPVINEDQSYYAVETLLPGITRWLLHNQLRGDLPPDRPEDDPSLIVDRKRLEQIIDNLEETPVIQ